MHRVFWKLAILDDKELNMEVDKNFYGFLWRKKNLN